MCAETNDGLGIDGTVGVGIDTGGTGTVGVGTVGTGTGTGTFGFLGFGMGGTFSLRGASHFAFHAARAASSW